MSKCANAGPDNPMPLKVIIPLLFLTMCVFVVSAQSVIKVEKASDHSTYIKGTDFEGVIFDQKYRSQYWSVDTILTRFTPSVPDVEKFEKALRAQIKRLNKKRMYQTDSTAIDTHLFNYRRQYLGYIDKRREKCIVMNCFIPGFADKKWKTDYYFVFDGGTSVWHVCFNLKSGKLSGFGTNGVG